MSESATGPHTMTDVVADERVDHVGVAVHLPEGGEDRQEAVIRNLRHLRAALTPGTQIELVAHGPGISVLDRRGPLANGVRDLSGVRLVACRNTMSRLGIEVADLLPGVMVVPAGIAHIVRRQAEGWAYVRP